MKHRCSPVLRGLSVAITLACLARSDAALAQAATPPEPARQHRDQAVELDTLEVREKRSRDQKAHDDVYDRNISNLHVDRQGLDRYRGVSTGDVFAGMNGVYNTDNRNGASLFPNIRGLSGNGRIPVTVDGTVQSLDVWMALRGINNRNYLDPNLFRSITVEKGPSMTRGVKSGIGGSVAVRTIEASDVIADDADWGIQVKVGAGSNSVKNPFDPFSIVGKDYRDVDGAISAAPYGHPGVGFTKPMIPTRERSEVSRYNLHDRRLFVASGYRNPLFDVMAAYSDQTRGNYFAGKHGAGDYLSNATDDYLGLRTDSRHTYPDIARLFAPRNEVQFTDSSTESLLLKNNWYLPNEQKLGFGYTRNRLKFGEFPSASMEILMGLLYNDKILDLAHGMLGYPFPATTVDQDVYRIGYEAKPAGSPWLNLDLNLWRTVNRNARYHTGDTTYLIEGVDLEWNDWVFCHAAINTHDGSCRDMIASGRVPPAHQPPVRSPNTDGQYTVYIGTLQSTRATRNGFDVSNRFRLGEQLLLTAAADWQREGQRDHVPVETAAMAGGLNTLFFGPASGRRQERGTSLKLDWKASDRLQVSAGVRYGNYSSYDEETEHRRGDEHWGWRDDRRAIAQPLRWSVIVDDVMADAIQRYWSLPQKWELDPATGEWHEVLTEEQAHYAKVMADYRRANNCDWGCQISQDTETGIYYMLGNTVDGKEVHLAEVPLHNRKADRHANPFHTGAINAREMVHNPQGKTGDYLRYKVGMPGEFTTVTPDDPWRRPSEQRLGAWSSQLVVSYRLFDRARTYARLGSMARFPSLMESANRMGRYGSDDYDLSRPERNVAWEVGYAHDLGGLLPRLPQADVKLSYYHNSIHNFFDRTEDMATIQFDRKVMSGLELQSRLDSGRVYGNLGISRRLTQKMCDKDYAVMLDPFHSRLPECISGGFPGTLARFALQPATSANLELGTRLFDARLQVGTRLRYHSGTQNRQVQRLLAENANDHDPGYAQTMSAILMGGSNAASYSWEPVRLVDLFAEYHFNPHATARLSVDNLTDRYYLDPLAKVATPGPGRTVMLDIAFKL